MTFVAAHPRELAALGVVVVLSLTRPGRWTWRHWWWPLVCLAGRGVLALMVVAKDAALRAILDDATVHRQPGRLDKRRGFTKAEEAAALRRDGPRCQCGDGRLPNGCGSDLHRYSGQCEVIHLEGQKLKRGHVIAHARGGRTTLANLAMVCDACNSAYRDRPMVLAARRRRWWHLRRRTIRQAPTVERVW